MTWSIRSAAACRRPARTIATNGAKSAGHQRLRVQRRQAPLLALGVVRVRRAADLEVEGDTGPATPRRRRRPSRSRPAGRRRSRRRPRRRPRTAGRRPTGTRRRSGPGRRAARRSGAPSRVSGRRRSTGHSHHGMPCTSTIAQKVANRCSAAPCVASNSRNSHGRSSRTAAQIRSSAALLSCQTASRSMPARGVQGPAGGGRGQRDRRARRRARHRARCAAGCTTRGTSASTGCSAGAARERRRSPAR